MDHAGANRRGSLWLETVERPAKPRVDVGSRFDVAIVGGGIVGVATAYALAGKGLRVGVIEALSLLGDVTGHTTGKLTAQHDLIYRYLLDNFGFEHATHYFEANTWAINYVVETSIGERISCDFAWDDAYVVCSDPKNAPDFAAENEAYEKLNIPGGLIRPEGAPFEIEAAITMSRQARYHPLKFLLGLVDRAEAAGVRFFENSRVLNVHERETECELETEHGPVYANEVVIATNYPIHDSGFFVAKLAPYRSYAMAIDVKEPLPEGMYITHEAEPLRSVRRAQHAEREVLIVGGEMHKVGQEAHTDQCYYRLESWCRQNFDVSAINGMWSAQDNFTADKIPYIGRSPRRERIYLATGFRGWGMTHGYVAAKLISDLILERPNPWEDLYRPSRIDIAMIPKVVKENVNAASHLIGDRLRSVEDTRLHMLQRGEATVVQMEKERIAAYRDDDGELHLLTSACTHWGCQVKWNPAERTWDCPCHGSRFDIDGNVLHGPAVTPLQARGVIPAHAVAFESGLIPQEEPA